MAHREQHGDREAKKPKKEMPEGGMTTQPTKWAADEVVEARIDSKALGSVPERRSHDPAPETYGIPDAQAFADRLWLLRPRARQAGIRLMGKVTTASWTDKADCFRCCPARSHHRTRPLSLMDVRLAWPASNIVMEANQVREHPRTPSTARRRLHWIVQALSATCP